MRTRFRNQHGIVVHTAVIDLLLLLIIAFLSTGVLAQGVAPKEADIQGMKDRADKAQREADEKRQHLEELQREYKRLQQELNKLLADLPKAVDQEKMLDEIEKLQQALSNIRQKLSKSLEAIASLTSEIAQLEQQSEASAKREKEWKALEANLKKRAADLLRLENEKKEQTKKLTELVKPRDPEKGSGKQGTPIVRRDRVARIFYGVTLSEGKVIPISPPYYTGTRRSDGSMEVWPALSGLTLEEALEPHSPLMKEIMTAEFRKEGQVNMFVTSDSFATFRALRDKLIDLGIDYGWEPVDRTRLRFVEKGEPIPSQGIR